MLSATPDRTSSLDLVRFVLSLISRNQILKASMQEDVFKILNQASRLANNPQDISDDLLPESIDLALQLRLHPDIQSIVRTVPDSNAITAEVANNLLEVMKPISNPHGG